MSDIDVLEKIDDLENHLNYKKLELRLAILEAWKDEMSAEIINRLLDQFTAKINKNLSVYMPRVDKMICDYERFLIKFQ